MEKRSVRVPVAELWKEVSEKDITTDFCVMPMEWIPPLFDFKYDEQDTQLQLHVTDGVGFFWEFSCVVKFEKIKRLKTFGCLVPTKGFLLPDGWLQFLNFKGLQVGDRLVFDTVANEFRGTRFRIRAQKKNQNGEWVDV